MFDIGSTIYCIESDNRRKIPCKVVKGIIEARVIRETMIRGEINRIIAYELTDGMSYGEIRSFSTEEEANKKCLEMNEYKKEQREKEKNFKL